MNRQLQLFPQASIEEGVCLFTSESVGEGTPRMTRLPGISCAVIDAHIFSRALMPNLLVKLPKTGMVHLAREITSRVAIDYQQVAREVIKFIGYKILPKVSKKLKY
uniref:S-adenosylmethionine synthetase N-terminal domain-containing protein n=1 Tax=Castor canadensis TaxID=51338 RepID=A0A8C0XTT5_CASCN